MSFQFGDLFSYIYQNAISIDSYRNRYSGEALTIQSFFTLRSSEFKTRESL